LVYFDTKFQRFSFNYINLFTFKIDKIEPYKTPATHCRPTVTSPGAAAAKQSLRIERRFQNVKVPRLLDNGTGWWYVCQPYAPAAFTTGNTPGTHFC
jgi:hypothetical protein